MIYLILAILSSAMIAIIMRLAQPRVPIPPAFWRLITLSVPCWPLPCRFPNCRVSHCRHWDFPPVWVPSTVCCTWAALP